ncbi:hypothetical protein SESBI_06421 [Sesbania bispinosa]|nr:hypothetical protein SESBI_06421 [Sesbania bispinosa]
MAMGRSRLSRSGSTCTSEISATNSLELLEFQGLKDVTSCNDGGSDSWTGTESGMACSFLEHTRLFPNFPPLVTGLGAGPATELGACYAESESGLLSGTAVLVVPISGPNAIFGSIRGSSSSLTFSPWR